jgi:hypothetical protein
VAPPCDGFLDPAVEALGFLHVDHRADERVAVVRIAGDQLAARATSGREVVVDVGVDDDALDADAGLAGLIEGAEDDPLDGVVEIGVMIDDHAALPPSSSTTFFLPALAFSPSRRRASR